MTLAINAIFIIMILIGIGIFVYFFIQDKHCCSIDKIQPGPAGPQGSINSNDPPLRTSLMVCNKPNIPVGNFSGNYQLISNIKPSTFGSGENFFINSDGLFVSPSQTTVLTFDCLLKFTLSAKPVLNSFLTLVMLGDYQEKLDFKEVGSSTTDVIFKCFVCFFVDPSIKFIFAIDNQMQDASGKKIDLILDPRGYLEISAMIP